MLDVTNEPESDPRLPRESGVATQREPSERRDPLGAVAGYALWALLGVMAFAWAALLWHPWIDWFGRAR